MASGETNYSLVDEGTSDFELISVFPVLECKSQQHAVVAWCLGGGIGQRSI